MEEVTKYMFQSNVKSFLKKLSGQPISCEINEDLKAMGFTKESLIQELIDRNFIKKIRKIENGETNKDDRFSISYEFFSKGFERKMERFYNDWRKKNPQNVNESTAAGAVTPGIGADSTMGNTGAYDTKLKMEGDDDNVIRKTKKIYITQQQLDEATTTFNSGNYEYDVPFPMDKKDPTLTRKKGFSMERLK